MTLSYIEEEDAIGEGKWDQLNWMQLDRIKLYWELFSITTWWLRTSSWSKYGLARDD